MKHNERAESAKPCKAVQEVLDRMSGKTRPVYLVKRRKLGMGMVERSISEMREKGLLPALP